MAHTTIMSSIPCLFTILFASIARGHVHYVWTDVDIVSTSVFQSFIVNCHTKAVSLIALFILEFLRVSRIGVTILGMRYA